MSKIHVLATYSKSKGSSLIWVYEPESDNFMIEFKFNVKHKNPFGFPRKQK